MAVIPGGSIYRNHAPDGEMTVGSPPRRQGAPAAPGLSRGRRQLRLICMVGWDRSLKVLGLNAQKFVETDRADRTIL
jgi:hypothetical protein